MPQLPLDIKLATIVMASEEHILGLYNLMLTSKEWHEAIVGDEVGWKLRARKLGCTDELPQTSWFRSFLAAYSLFCIGCGAKSFISSPRARHDGLYDDFGSNEEHNPNYDILYGFYPFKYTRTEPHRSALLCSSCERLPSFQIEARYSLQPKYGLHAAEVDHLAFGDRFGHPCTYPS
jgi:hypothetical protein